MSAPAAERATPANPGPLDTPSDAISALSTFAAHRSPQILIFAAIAAWAVRLVYGQWGLADLWVSLALLLAWPLKEWLIHVCILHFRPRRWRGRALDLAVARDHRRHHDDPWNLRWVFIPLHVYPWSLPLLLVAGWLVPGTGAGLSFIAVYLTLALHYEWSHYLAHIQWTPPLGHYRQRVREHRLHHFRNHRYWWGVSMGSADRWLRTSPTAATVEKGTRSLHKPAVSEH